MKILSKQRLGIVGIIVSYAAFKLVLRNYRRIVMQAKAQKKRSMRDQQIAQVDSILEPVLIAPEVQQRIFESTINEIQTMIHEGLFTITQLVTLYIRRCIDIAYPLNYLADINFEEALAKARQQDQMLLNDRDIILREENPLFGIPVTIKDTYNMKDKDSVFGLASRCFKPEKYNSLQVEMIIRAGGIILAKSNVPQLGLSFETNNHVFGRAKHPFYEDRTTGGSSGGEAGLLAKNCSVVGLGSDVGGSIRIPAMFCGLVGLKPMNGRFTCAGELRKPAGTGVHASLLSSKGPLARNVDDLVLMMKLLLDRDSYDQLPFEIKDHYWKPSPWNDQIYLGSRSLKIGVWSGTSFFQPAQCMIRGVLESVQILREKGYDIVEFNIPEQLVLKLVKIFIGFVSAEGSWKSFKKQLNGEQYISEYKLMSQSAHTPNFVIRFLQYLTFLGGKTRENLILQSCQSLDAYGYVCLVQEQMAAQREFLEFWHERNIDVLICPSFALPAIKHGNSNRLHLAALYTFMFNVLNLPAGVVPVTVVGLEETHYGYSHDLVGQLVNKNLQNSSGLPVGVQIVALQEELTARVMKDIHSITVHRLKEIP